MTVQQNSIQSAMKTLDKRISSTEESINRKMEMLKKQFITLDSAMAQMQNMSSWLSTQLASMSSQQRTSKS